ncbi:MAG: hypothetical protein RL885_04370 [Planctomycetota bacterium]
MRDLRPWMRLALVLLLIALVPGLADACPNCKDAVGSSRIASAFNWSIILMILSPFAIFGGISFWIYRLCRVPQPRQ